MLMPHPRKTSSLPFIFAFVSSVWADYYIDDTNTTLTYTSGPKAAWSPYATGGETLDLLLPNGTFQAINPSVCWNHTYRYAACFDTDTCVLHIPFTGSGITLFVYQAGPVGINASISIDGAHAETNALPPPPTPIYEIANVSMFDVQQLASGLHTLDLLVNDLFGSYSNMMFDYAYVNESLVAKSTTTSAITTSTGTVSTSEPAPSSTSTLTPSSTSAPTPSSTPTPAPSSTSTPAPSSAGSHTNTGVIVGSVIAGVALIVAGVLVMIWVRRRRGHGPEMIDLHSGSASPPLYPMAPYDLPSSNPSQACDPYAGYNPSMSSNIGSNLTPSHSIGQDILTPFIATSSGSDTNSSGTNNRKTQDAVLNNTNTPSLHPIGSRQDMTPSLTDGQADFINSLHQNNVPATAIARVVERMLVDRHAGIREWEGETQLARANTRATAPPSYDLVANRE